ncbi:MAG: hypothetical protein M0017_13445 [Desulfobacteraceae bacterium]|nr:hypothetical protein [Desulfobacteraceae bacterium]
MAVTEKERVKTWERGEHLLLLPARVEERPESIKDIQRFYMVLSPGNRERFRLAVIGGKRLPEPGHKGQRFWGFVDLVRKSPASLRDELSGDQYRTKTRSERHVPAARPAGEGVYRLLRHGGHTHLVYALELPKEPGEVQEELRIEPEASYTISVKNPEAPSPRGVGLRPSERAELPKSLMEVFRGRRFAEADPPELLDREGADLVLIAAAEDLKEEMGSPWTPRRRMPSMPTFSPS